MGEIIAGYHSNLCKIFTSPKTEFLDYHVVKTAWALVCFRWNYATTWRSDRQTDSHVSWHAVKKGCRLVWCMTCSVVWQMDGSFTELNCWCWCNRMILAYYLVKFSVQKLQKGLYDYTAGQCDVQRRPMTNDAAHCHCTVVFRFDMLVQLCIQRRVILTRV